MKWKQVWIRRLSQMAMMIALAVPITGYCEPPWSVDDPGITPQGTLTLFKSYYRQHSWEETLHSLPGFSIVLGVSERAEVGVGIDALISHSPDQGRKRGFGDLSFSYKQRLLGALDDSRLAFAYQIILPTGNEPFTADSVEQGIWLTFQHPLGQERLIGNAGFNYAPKGTRWVPLFGFVLDRAIHPKTVIGIQLTAHGPTDAQESWHFSTGVGIRYQWTPTLNLQAMIGKDIASARDEHFFLGLSWDLSTR